MTEQTTTKPRYHDKKFPKWINVRLTNEQYAKIKGNASNIIRGFIDEYEPPKTDG